MSRSIIKIAICFLFIGCVNAFGAELCSADKIEQKIEGIWEGRNIYYFKLRINDAKKLCISILDDKTEFERNIRDIVIVNGKLKHFSYFTPSTQAYIVYTNINIEGDEMNYYMFSSYDNRNGKDSLRKRKAAKSAEHRAFSNENFSDNESYSFLY